LPPKDVGLSRSIRTEEVVSKLSPISKHKVEKSTPIKTVHDVEINGTTGSSKDLDFSQTLPTTKTDEDKRDNLSIPMIDSTDGPLESPRTSNTLPENEHFKEQTACKAAKAKLVLDCSNVEPIPGAKLSPIASSPIENPLK